MKAIETQNLSTQSKSMASSVGLKVAHNMCDQAIRPLALGGLRRLASQWHFNLGTTSFIATVGFSVSVYPAVDGECESRLKTF